MRISDWSSDVCSSDLQEIRIKRGLSYGAGSQMPGRREVGPFKAATQTKNPSAAEVISLIVAEMAKLGAAPAPAAELDTRKAVLVGSFGRAVETTDGKIGRASCRERVCQYV